MLERLEALMPNQRLYDFPVLIELKLQTPHRCSMKFQTQLFYTSFISLNFVPSNVSVVSSAPVSDEKVFAHEHTQTIVCCFKSCTYIESTGNFFPVE